VNQLLDFSTFPSPPPFQTSGKKHQSGLTPKFRPHLIQLNLDQYLLLQLLGLPVYCNESLFDVFCIQLSSPLRAIWLFLTNFFSTTRLAYCRINIYPGDSQPMLLENPYVVVISIDSSKAFDSVCHFTLLKKLALLDIPDQICNWLVNLFTRQVAQDRCR